MTPEDTDLEQVGLAILKRMTREMADAGISKEHHPPLLADHLMYMVLAMGGDLAEHAALSILGRMEGTLNDWRQGKPPFEKYHRRELESGEAAHGFSALRGAMEYLVQFQKMPLDQAAACMGLFAMGLVNDHEGIERVRALLGTWSAEVEQMQGAPSSDT